MLTRPYNDILRQAVFISEVTLIALVLRHVRPACAAHEDDIGELLFREPSSPVVQVYQTHLPLISLGCLLAVRNQC